MNLFGQALRFQALDLATSRDNQLWRAYAFRELGEMHADMQRPHEAKDYLHEALALYEINNARAEVNQIRQILAELSSEEKFTPS